MDEQNLWHLLGRAPRPAAPPFFAAKVMRRIARPAPRWPFLRWLAPATVAALVMISLLPRPATPQPAAAELTTLDLLGMLCPEDHELLSLAGWPYDNGPLTAGL
jgi:hypothetical protein